MFSYSRFTHEYKKSYFNFVEPISKDYTVSVNGEEIPVYTCRISAYPLNRVWTTYQRPYEQSEDASFVNIVTDGAEPLHFSVKAAREHKKVLIKPYSRGITADEKDGIITFTAEGTAQLVLETDDYHHCLYIFISSPIEAPEESDVTYYFGAGIHFPGKISLKSNESVYIDRDALVYGCIFAEDAENIHIFGNGILDDTGEGRINRHCYEAYTNGNIKFYDCRNVNIEGVGMRNSAIWCLNIFHCFDVSVDGVKIFGQWRYNTDGIDVVNSQRVTVRNSFIHSFDDTITVKGIDRYALTDNRDMLFEDCVLWCDWGKTCEIGLETACREYKNITFRGCDILRAGNTALDIQNGDCAEVSDITFEDINVEYEPFYTLSQYQSTDDTVYTNQDKLEIANLVSIVNYRFRSTSNCSAWGLPDSLLASPDLNGITIGGVHDILIRNITVYYPDEMPRENGKCKVPIVTHSCLPDVRYYNITVENVRINGVRLTEDEAVLSVGETDSFIFR